MQLHELEHLKYVLELKEPLRFDWEENSDSIANALPARHALINSSVDYIKDSLRVLNSDLRDETLIVLEYMNVEFLGLPRPIHLQLTNSEL